VVTFFFDLGSPYAYLAAERLPAVFTEPVKWQPVLLGGLFKLTGRSSWAAGDPDRRAAGIAEIEARAGRYGLPPIRWPDPWPADGLFAMRVATYAFAAGVGPEFTLAAFRQAFLAGANLSLPAEVLRVAEAVGLDAAGAENAAADPQLKRGLRRATDAAQAAGVFGVPTITVGNKLFWGDDRLEDAAAAASRSAN
jgi:2-hydroxychromene-2-carboxylate isomerase